MHAIAGDHPRLSIVELKTHGGHTGLAAGGVDVHAAAQVLLIFRLRHSEAQCASPVEGKSHRLEQRGLAGTVAAADEDDGRLPIGQLSRHQVESLRARVKAEVLEEDRSNYHDALLFCIERQLAVFGKF
jgi:hypothetical protein